LHFENLHKALTIEGNDAARAHHASTDRSQSHVNTRISRTPFHAQITHQSNVPSNGETAEKLVSQRFALRHGAQPAVVHLFRVKLHRTFREPEPALHERGQLTNASTLFAKHVRGDTDFHAGVPILGELADEHFVKLGEEDAVGDELFACAR
jgi:hypothetical protein